MANGEPTRHPSCFTLMLKYRRCNILADLVERRARRIALKSTIVVPGDNLGSNGSTSADRTPVVWPYSPQSTRRTDGLRRRLLLRFLRALPQRS